MSVASVLLTLYAFLLHTVGIESDISTFDVFSTAGILTPTTVSCLSQKKKNYDFK
jgi:hypothetical protein